ncbi:hypothetical protein RFM98_30995, partial [Mesorhizobium sp. VK9D]|uniref:hypothetical protein n=1 Tax=Mesorhizobium australafricanum TaxID=3072311 RepID=UPI002A24B486
RRGLNSAISVLLFQDCASTAAILQNRSLNRKPTRQMPRQRLRCVPSMFNRLGVKVPLANLMEVKA